MSQFSSSPTSALRRHRLARIRGTNGMLVLHQTPWTGQLSVAYHGARGEHASIDLGAPSTPARRVIEEMAQFLDRLERLDPACWRDFLRAEIRTLEGRVFLPAIPDPQSLTPVIRHVVPTLSGKPLRAGWHRIDPEHAGLAHALRAYPIYDWLESERLIGKPDWHAKLGPHGELLGLLVLWEDAIDMNDCTHLSDRSARNDAQVAEMIDGIAAVYLPTDLDQLPTSEEIEAVLDPWGYAMTGSVGSGRLVREFEIFLDRKPFCE